MFSAKRLLKKIRDFRKQKRLTQTAFAKQIGTSCSTLSCWEREKRSFNPDLTQIINIAKAMGLTPGELLSQGKNTANAPVKDKKASKTVKKTQPEKKQSKRTVKPSKTAAASKEIKVKKTSSTKEAVKKGRKASVKAAKTSIAKTAVPAKKETSKRKPGRPRKQPKA